MIQKILSSFLLLLIGLGSVAQLSPEARKKQYNLEKNALAIGGYDPVSYFNSKGPIKGSEKISFDHRGVRYYFATDANRRAFQQEPARYEPQYGGWCAYAMGSDGSKVEVDPETYKIVNGQLFLFYNRFFNNTLKTWNKDEAGLHRKADVNWKKYTAQ